MTAPHCTFGNDTENECYRSTLRQVKVSGGTYIWAEVEKFIELPCSVQVRLPGQCDVRQVLLDGQDVATPAPHSIHRSMPVCTHSVFINAQVNTILVHTLHSPSHIYYF